ncbi:MAG: hypothetical protein IPG45_18060 [Deltaproteobacteria bacterium]|nr:hypothetical protein [Deltaproteobacteria bacterium]
MQEVQAMIGGSKESRLRTAVSAKRSLLVLTVVALTACAAQTPPTTGGSSENRRVTSTCPAALVEFGCISTDRGRPRIPGLAIASLLSHPRLFDNTEVVVSGNLSTRFEDLSVYMDRQSYDFGISENKVYVVTSTSTVFDEPVQTGEVVMVDGVFFYQDRTHFSHPYVEALWVRRLQKQDDESTEP